LQKGSYYHELTEDYKLCMNIKTYTFVSCLLLIMLCQHLLILLVTD